VNELLKILIPILIQIESGGDNLAIGDNGDAVGCLQMHKIMVDDINRIQSLKFKDCSEDYYRYKDRLDRVTSKMMCEDYMNHYGPKRISKDNTELVNLIILGRMWNGGPQGHKKKATLLYTKKIMKLYNEMQYQ